MVRGPRRFFVVDGHHTLCAIMEAKAPRELVLDQVADYADADSEEAFWKKMKKKGLLYPRRLGEGGLAHGLPQDVGGPRRRRLS